ncbi:MAG: hypothetical protein IT256_08670, partial [Chitinophagaceae bacterium]|nr:hypothetical protein [Chitinophagaceae bacterium]
NKLLFARHNNEFLYQYFFGQAAWMYRAAYHTRHILSVGYNHYRVGDTVLQLNNDFFAKGSKQLSYLELAYRYEYNGVDNWNYPRRGLKVVASLASRWGLAGMGYQALSGLELGVFRPLHNRWYGSLVLRGKAIVAQQQQPYFLAAAFGYKTNYVRGYEYYVVEANNFAIARLSLKYEAVRKRFEKLPFRYLPQLPLWLYPKLFLDAGYASNKNISNNNNNLANRLLYSVGMGIDIITAYDLKLRIEFAYNHLGENGLYLHANSE